MNANFIEMSGRRCGRWLVVQRAANKKNGSAVFSCLCDCGTTRDVAAVSLRNGTSTSCGCINKERLTKHGWATSKIYKVWKAMIQRCNDKGCVNYHNYGGRGVTICAGWYDFFTFLEDMGADYQQGLTLDRIKNNKGYYKENCQWTTNTENCRNTRKTRFITHNGIKQSMKAWSEQLGMNYGTLQRRLDLKWDIDTAFNRPVRPPYQGRSTHVRNYAV